MAPTKTHNIAPFTLSSPPNTDIWRKPPTHDVFTAPVHPAPLPKFPLQSFQRARITFALPPVGQLVQYDQAGLVLHLTKKNGHAKDKWLKTGVEFYNGAPYISTVGADRWADWSVVPLGAPASTSEAVEATIEVRRERDQLGKGLWVYHVVRDGEGKEECRPLREVTWFFADEEEGGWEIGVGGMVARPAKEEHLGELEARFERGVEVEILA